MERQNDNLTERIKICNRIIEQRDKYRSVFTFVVIAMAFPIILYIISYI